MDVNKDEPIRLAGRTIKRGQHICAFFHSREDRDRMLMPFFKEGIDRGERVFHIVDADRRDDHLCSLRNHGIETASTIENGQLEINHWEDTYLKDGFFDGDRMVRMLREALDANREKYGISRCMGEMEWASTKLPGVTDIVEYETKINSMMANFPDPLICVYDLNKHSGSVVMDILRTHPMVILGGGLQENPFYVPPDEFLKELRERAN